MHRRARRRVDSLISGMIASAGAALLAFAGSVTFGPCAYAEANGECDGQSVEWRGTSRDVYVDGELDMGIVAWSGEERLALLLPDELDALVVERVDGELRLLSMPKTSWSFENPQTATSMPPERELEGKVFAVADGFWLDTGGRHILIAPHQGEPGEMDVGELWRRAPLWKDLHGAYEPDAEAVEALANEERELVITVAFGTWCGDSRRSVPRLLKTLDAAANPNISVELVSIDRSFTDPLGFVSREQVTNVPTVIVREGDREIGRFVERPRSEVVESDVAALLTGHPVPPGVFFDDDDTLIASGVLGLYDGERRVGEERWSLFATEDGGRRLHVRQTDADGGTETWMRLDGGGAAAFAEVTRRGDVELSRTRLYRSGDSASSTTRGDATGIVRQNVDWPAEAVLLAPGISGVGLAWRQAGRPAERRSLSAYALASVAASAPGRVEAATLDWIEAAPLKTKVGSIDGVAVRLEHGERSGRYWLHREFDMPVAVELDDGRRYLLESLERPATPAEASASL